jgi:hypothetical protein
VFVLISDNKRLSAHAFTVRVFYISDYLCFFFNTKHLPFSEGRINSDNNLDEANNAELSLNEAPLPESLGNICISQSAVSSHSSGNCSPPVRRSRS